VERQAAEKKMAERQQQAVEQQAADQQAAEQQAAAALVEQLPQLTLDGGGSEATQLPPPPPTQNIRWIGAQEPVVKGVENPYGTPAEFREGLSSAGMLRCSP